MHPRGLWSLSHQEFSSWRLISFEILKTLNDVGDRVGNGAEVDRPILNGCLRQFDRLNGQLHLLFLIICVSRTGNSEHGSVNQPQSAPSGELGEY